MCDICVMNAVKDKMLSRRQFFGATAAAGAAGPLPRPNRAGPHKLRAGENENVEVTTEKPGVATAKKATESPLFQRSSKIGSFSAVVSFALFDCPSEGTQKVMAFHQEEMVKLGRCDQEVCDWRQFRERYAVREIKKRLRNCKSTWCQYF